MEGTDLRAWEATLRYQELLKEAAQERLARQVAAQQPGFQMRMLQNLGNALISLGQSLKTLSLTL
ncbi:MAG: hypothetical protein JXM69_03055 [Anaerolineae bacterium]|nr:hypothetical protein [Anaerolineae bacterium]